MKKHQDFYEVLHKTGRDTVLRQSLRKKIGVTKELSNLDAYQKVFFADGVSGWIDLDAYQKVFFADGVSGWIEEWIERGMQETPEELNELLCQYFNNVLSSLGRIFTHD